MFLISSVKCHMYMVMLPEYCTVVSPLSFIQTSRRPGSHPTMILSFWADSLMSGLGTTFTPIIGLFSQQVNLLYIPCPTPLILAQSDLAD